MIDNKEIDEDRKQNEDTVTALRWERQMYGSQTRYSDDCLPEFFLDGLRINYGRKEKKIQHSKDKVEN